MTGGSSSATVYHTHRTQPITCGVPCWRVCVASGISERGGHVVYKANVKEIITEPLPAGEASSSGSSGADVRATGAPDVVQSSACLRDG